MLICYIVCAHSGQGAPLLARKTTRQHWNFGGGNDQRNGLRRLYYEGNKTHQYQGIVMATTMCLFFLCLFCLIRFLSERFKAENHSLMQTRELDEFENYTKSASTEN